MALYDLLKERCDEARKKFDIFGDSEQENNEFESPIPDNIQYVWTPGKRFNSELMFSLGDEFLYVSNGKIVKRENAEAFTCYIKECKGRVFLKANGIAYIAAPHTVDHGSMYKDFICMQCRHEMRENCKTADASKSVKHIYEDAVIR